MWETPFEEWMLADPKGLAIHCPDEHLAKELFEVFRQNGVGENWNNDLRHTQWDSHKEETTYYVMGKRMLYGPKEHGNKSEPYCRYTKCTFYGIDYVDPMQDIEVNEEEFLAVLNALGG